MTTVTPAPATAPPVERFRAAPDSPEVAAAQSHLAGADLLVDVDLVVRRAGGEARMHARHALSGHTVHALATAGTPEVEVARLDVADWQAELARTCRVALPAGQPAPPASGLCLPWDLVVGTGAALDRPDLYAVLVARAVGSVTAGGRVLDAAATRVQLSRLHRSVVGRLRATGTVPGRRRVGWVSWLLFADGWRSLTPCTAEGPDGRRARVLLERREPDDLARDVARWATEVPR